MSGIPPLDMAILSGVSSAIGISEQNKALEAQQQAAVQRTEMMYQQEAQEQQEIITEAGLEATEEKRKKLRERGAIQAAQAESGVAGASPLRELANTYMQEAINTGTIISKQEAELRASGMRSQQYYLEGVSAVNQAEAQKTTGLAAALQIGTSAAQGQYMQHGSEGFSFLKS